MKSALFSKRGDLAENEKFRKDINRISDLPLGVLMDVVPLAIEFMNAPTDDEESKISDKASEKFALAAWTMKRVLTTSVFFITQFSKSGKASLDQPKDIATDLSTILVEPNEEKTKRLTCYLEKLSELAKERAEPALARRRVAQACLPILESADMVVDFRVVYDEPYKLGDKVESYSPQVLGAMPMGIIKMNLSEGACESFAFQADERTIALLIDELRALQKQVEVAKINLGFEE